MHLTMLILLLCACCVAHATQTTLQFDLENAEHHFKQFIKEYGKQYYDENEKQARFEVFKNKLEEVNHLNAISKHAIYGITKFMDMTDEELKSQYTGYNVPKDVTFPGFCNLLTDDDIPDVNAPDSFDWREKNAVARVKNQGNCGNCYIFSAMGAVEGQLAIKKGRLVDLSAQQLLDCGIDAGCGCYGGDMAKALRFFADYNMGWEPEADYPYTSALDNCKYNASKAVVNVKTCHSYNITSQEKLKQLLYSYGPVAVALKPSILISYKGGIISDEECEKSRRYDMLHAVVLVGYGTENGMPYWLLKNSWGSYHGEHGYFRLIRGEGAYSCYLLNREMTTAIIE